MALEDFEKELAAEKVQRDEQKKRHHSRSPHRSEKHSKHRHHHRHHRRSPDGDNERHRRHRSKRTRTEDSLTVGEEADKHRASRSHARQSESDSEEARQLALGSAAPPPVDEVLDARIQDYEDAAGGGKQRDAWMQAPAAIDLEYIESRWKEPKSHRVRATMDEPRMELRDGLQEGAEASNIEAEKQAANQGNYKFGDAGSHWRMTKLRGVYQTAKQTGRSEEEVAIERFGDLRSFDDAREEELELDRRDRYGKDYVGKEKPSGELYQERKLAQGIRTPASPRSSESDSDEGDSTERPQGSRVRESDPPNQTVPLDQTALNKLKAQMMKAKLRNAPDAAALEASYNAALSTAASQRQPDVVVLNKMEARELAGGRGSEVKHLTNKRGRERGLVEENEDMTIADMVRQERRTKHNAGAEANRALADRIAQDSSFANDLDYIDENSGKLSKLDAKSEGKLRSAAIASHRRTLAALASCPLCHHDDAAPPHDQPQAPVVSLATRVYLTLPTSPEINQRHGLCATLVPRQHRRNLLECDDDEWEELRNFMKSLARFYNAQSPPLSPVFYENAARADARRHASLECVPLPRELAEQAPAFFRESILASDEEWTQHRKLIDTLAKAEEHGLGKLAFRRSMVPDVPYFHVWFKIDGGLGHVVEDANRWPKGDLFARETLGGMLDTAPEVVRRQGRWRRGDADMQERVSTFRGLRRGKKGWDAWDWTKMLIEAQQ